MVRRILLASPRAAMLSNLLKFMGFFCLIGSVACAGSQVDRGDRQKGETRLELAKDYLSRQELEAASQEAQKAIDYDPESAEAFAVLGLISLVRGVQNHNLLEIDDCLTGADAEALREEFDAHLTSADKHFEHAIELDGEYSEAMANRGVIAIHMADYEGALEHLKRALAVPHRLENIGLTRANLGWAYFHTGDLARAAKALRQALQFSPGMCVANYRLGRVYFAREEWNKALEQFQAVAADHSCPVQEAHLYLLKTMNQLGQPKDPTNVQACTRMAPRSCVAAECRTL